MGKTTNLVKSYDFPNPAFYTIAGGHQGRASRGIRGHQRTKTPFWWGISTDACFHKTCTLWGIRPAEVNPFKILKRQHGRLPHAQLRCPPFSPSRILRAPPSPSPSLAALPPHPLPNPPSIATRSEENQQDISKTNLK